MESTNQQQVPQQPALLAYLDRIAVALENAIPLDTAPVRKPRASGAAIMPGLSSEDRTALKDLKGDLAQVKAELAQIKKMLTAQKGEVVKEAYTVEEVVKKTNYKPFTIRQACNKGRIEGAYKGRDHAWRIPRNSLLDILANGLPPE
jgi:CHAT domain-containing protein